jgi:hypothetical protein
MHATVDAVLQVATDAHAKARLGVFALVLVQGDKARTDRFHKYFSEGSRFQGYPKRCLRGCRLSMGVLKVLI